MNNYTTSDPIEPKTENELIESPPKLTVAQFIKDMARFPQDSEILACLTGIGLTIAITQATQVTSVDGKELTILHVDRAGALNALRHDMGLQREAMEQTVETNNNVN